MPNWPASKLMDTVVGVDVHTTVMRLQQMGLSALGAMQVLRGEPITLPADRSIVATIVAAVTSREFQGRDVHQADTSAGLSRGGLTMGP